MDNAQVASVSPTGVLSATTTLGYLTVNASCESRTARVETKVAATSPYKMVIFTPDDEVSIQADQAATMEFLDGARAGQRMRVVDTLLNNGVSNFEWPVKVRFTAPSYDSKEFEISESAGKRRNAESNIFDVRVPLHFVPDALTDTYVRKMSSTQMEIAHPFTLQSPGSVDVRTWWGVDYNDGLTITLWCDGRLLRTMTQRMTASGQGFAQDVSAAGTCEVRLRQLKSDAHTQYRVAIRYPH